MTQELMWEAARVIWEGRKRAAWGKGADLMIGRAPWQSHASHPECHEDHLLALAEIKALVKHFDLSRPALSPPAEGNGEDWHKRVSDHATIDKDPVVSMLRDAHDRLKRTPPDILGVDVGLHAARLAVSTRILNPNRTPTPAPADHIGDATEKVDWTVVGPKLVEALDDLIGEVFDAVCEDGEPKDCMAFELADLVERARDLARQYPRSLAPTIQWRMR